MEWIKISDQKPPNQTWIILGKVYEGVATVWNIGEYIEKTDKYQFPFIFECEQPKEEKYNKIGVMHKNVLAVFDANTATHWMSLDEIKIG